MNKSRKLWVVTYNFYPVWSGVAERFLRYNKGFKARNVHVVYITTAHAKHAQKEKYRGAEIIRLGDKEKKISVRKFINLAAKYAIKNNTRSSTFLVLLASYFNVNTIRNLSKKGIRTVYVNSMMFEISNSKNIFRRWLSKELSLRFFKVFDIIISSTSTLKEPIVALGIKAEKVKIISNGVSLDRFKPVESELEIKTIHYDLNLPDDEPIVLYAGLSVERKGVVELVKSWQLYKENGGKGYLLMVGGEERSKPIFAPFYLEWDKVLASIKKEHKIIIHDASDQLEKYFRISKLFVLLSKKEGMANVLIEAMASGCPIITTNFTGFSFFDLWTQNGIIVVKREYKEIASTIDNILNKEENRQAIKNVALRYVEKEHDLEHTLDGYTKLIKCVE